MKPNLLNHFAQMKGAFVLLPLSAAVMLSLPCRAGVVTTTSDAGPGSLRDAISAAVPGETITFSVSGVITLTSAQLAVNKDLSISGPGAAILSVQRSAAVGTPDFRIFDLQ